jgi:cobalt-zinc-cadmium efflux system membrane fusion protein
MNKSLLIILGVTIGAAASFGAWRQLSDPLDLEHEHVHEEEEPSSLIEMDESKAAHHGIAIKPAGPGKLEIQLTSRGKVVLHPDNVAHILPKISGVAIEARKNRGDSVEAGEVIAILESREMAETNANYLAALEKEKLSKSLFDREERLYQKKVSSEQDYLSANATWQDAKIGLQLSKQKLIALGLDDHSQNADLRFYEIRSPIKGTVIARDITYGEYVEERTPIYAIADLSKVWVEIGIYQKDFPNVKINQLAEISIPDADQKATGKIIYVSPIIDEDTITAKAVVELDNTNGEWKPGSFVTAKIQVQGVDVPVMVSEKAVQMIEGEPIVFIRKEEGFEKTSVRLGRSDGNNVEVIAGIEPGTHYACTNSFLLKADLGKDSVEHED